MHLHWPQASVCWSPFLLQEHVISTITSTVAPNYLQKEAGAATCFINFRAFSMLGFFGTFFTNCRPINELISIGKPFPPILLNLCTLMTGLRGNLLSIYAGLDGG